MVKKKPKIDVFSKTGSQPTADPMEARGVGLKRSEWEDLDQRARALGLSAHALALILLRYGINHLKTGKIKPSTEKVTVTRTKFEIDQ